MSDTAANFRRMARVVVANDLTPDAFGRRVAAYARADRDAHIGRGEAPSRFSTLVNGVEGAAEETVRPTGAIVYQFALLGIAAEWCMFRLVMLSPFARTPSPKTTRTTRPRFENAYREQWVYAVGERMTKFRKRQVQAERYRANRIIRPESFDPSQVDADVAEILIFNRAPYARKVEVQLVGAKPLHFSVPAGFIEQVASEARRRFPSLDFRRIYQVNFPGQYTIRYGQKAGQPSENPALVISYR